jgi:type VI protein secretion system component VasK
MNGLNVFGLTALTLLLMAMLLRVERRALWVVVVLLWLPAVLAVGRWASVGGHWGEVALALAIALPLTLVWWLAVGRRLPAPTSDNIKVIGRDKVVKPKPEEMAALRSEVEALQADKQRLEAELRQMKGGNNGGKPKG